MFTTNQRPQTDANLEKKPETFSAVLSQWHSLNECNTTAIEPTAHVLEVALTTFSTP